MSKLTALKELAYFLGRRKRYWVVPIITILILFGALVLLSEGSAIAPFVYTLF
jgi:hypothetical protein